MVIKCFLCNFFLELDNFCDIVTLEKLFKFLTLPDNNNNYGIYILQRTFDVKIILECVLPHWYVIIDCCGLKVKRNNEYWFMDEIKGFYRGARKNRESKND